MSEPQEKAKRSMWPKGSQWTPANITKAIVVILGAIATFITAAFGGVTGLERLINAVRNTSAEFALLRAEITTAREEISATNSKLVGLDEWRQDVDERANHQAEEIKSTAQLAVKLNGGPPGDGWPESYEGQWTQPPQPRKIAADFRSKRPFDPTAKKKED